MCQNYSNDAETPTQHSPSTATGARARLRD